MNSVPVEHVLALAAVLFALGLATLLARRNVLFLLVAVEIMLNAAGTEMVPPVEVSRALYGPYLLAVELASLVLLAGLVGAYNLGRRERGGGEEDGRGPR